MKNTQPTAQNNFCNQLNELRKQAISKLKNSGSRILFDTTEDDMDNIWELPSTTYIGKHFDYYNYAITSYKVENDEIVFFGLETGEVSDTMEFSVQEIETFTLCLLADELDEQDN